jgi:hypothetical protein
MEPLKIEKAPRFAEDITPEMVLVHWIKQLQGATIRRPHKALAYRTLKVTDDEFRAFCVLMDKNGGAIESALAHHGLSWDPGDNYATRTRKGEPEVPE